MQTIDTGYRPDGALGALYAGQNAANAQSMNDEELAKLFLANQQSMQMNPLDVIGKQQQNQVGAYDAALAQAKQSSPSYIPMALAGQEGQMQSQMTAADSGKALAPFKVAAEQSGLETEKNKQGVLWTLQDLDKQLAAGGGIDESGNVTPFNPMQKMFMQNKRAELTNQLQTTPEWTGKKDINDADNATKLAIAQLQADAMRDRAATAAGPKTPKPPTTAEAAMTQQILANPNMDENEKHQLLQEIFNAKQQNKNASGSDVALVFDDNGKLKMGQRAVNAPVKQVLPVGGQVKELNDNDKAALAWAEQNPNDPRAAKIKTRLGK